MTPVSRAPALVSDGHDEDVVRPRVGDFTSLVVPLLGVEKFLIRFPMKPDRRHLLRNKRARTSSQGIVSTAPDSISCHRRSASADQSSSTSGSGGGSRLSISSPARVARSPSERSNASRNIVCRSRAIGRHSTAHSCFSASPREPAPATTARCTSTRSSTALARR